MKRRKGQLLAEIRQALTAHPDGLDSGALARHCGMERARMAVELWLLRRAGHLRASGGREQIWSLVPAIVDSSEPDQLVTPRGARRGGAIPALEHVTMTSTLRTVVDVRTSAVEAGLVLSPDVKITVCPRGMDNRYSVDPRGFTGGESMADWRRLRAGSSKGIA